MIFLSFEIYPHIGIGFDLSITYIAGYHNYSIVLMYTRTQEASTS